MACPLSSQRSWANGKKHTIAIENHAAVFVDEFRVFDENGNIRYLSAEAIIEYENDEAACMIGINRDITKYKQIELALRDNAEKFHQTIFYGPIGKAIVDLEGKLLDTNPALWKLLGYSKTQFLSMSIMDVTYPIDINIDKILMALSNMLRGMLRVCEIIGRLGGDEFIIFHPEILRSDEINALTDWITYSHQSFSKTD